MSTTSKRALVIGLGIAMLAAVGMFAVACQGADEQEIDAERLPMAAERMADELELDEAQREHLYNIRDMAEEHREQHVAEREEHFTKLRASVATGEVDDQEIHSEIDRKAEEMTALAHRVADELIALVRSLEPDQRERAVERLDTMHERMQRFHERMDLEEGGPRGFFAKMRAHRCGGGPFGHLMDE